MNKYEAVIGLEIHIELKTNSKMFCSCSADYFGADPNTHTCPVCLGLPGALPKANSKAIQFAQMLGIALNCSSLLVSKFDRKNYFYPDLAKGYQISQYDLPFSQKGFILIETSSGEKKIEVTRAHMEEDTAKLAHSAVNGRKVSLIDFNRSGLPLVEIVSEPQMHSSEEAKAYAQKLQQIVRYLKISDCDMERGTMRIEPNVSLRKTGEKSLPPYKVELKNINSFRFAQKAIEFEIARQAEILDKGETPALETRGWDEAKNRTFSQRAKEMAHDYRYFPEPDLPPYEFDAPYIQNIKSQMIELPDAKKQRFQQQYQLSPYDAALLTQDSHIADFFEKAAGIYEKGEPKRIANWVIGELLRRLNEQAKTLDKLNLLPAQMVELLVLTDEGKITPSGAKEVFENMISSGKSALELIDELGIKTIPDDEIKKVVDEVLGQNAKAIEEYRNGKKQTLGFLIGQVQRQTKGAADPVKTTKLILEKIGE